MGSAMSTSGGGYMIYYIDKIKILLKDDIFAIICKRELDFTEKIKRKKTVNFIILYVETTQKKILLYQSF